MNQSTQIRVRFAPSPTGYLHIGGARTALFNYLFAKNRNGQFLLRIEDTDVNRSDRELTEVILRSLSWLGLPCDETIVYQSQRAERHHEICRQLLESGQAYRCFCSVDQLQAKRDEAQKIKSDTKYDRTCLNLTKSEVQTQLDHSKPFALRFRVPEGETQFCDLIRGNVCVQHHEIEDFIIQRSDGTPTYQIAVVSDDHDMEISHIIRGDDHLSNTPKQILIYHAMNWSVPQFGHVPMILGADKKRLSKRHGATSVEAYQEAGIVPEALVNYLALLGWNPGDDREIFNLQDLIRTFSIERISGKAAVFDEQKLEWMNSVYLAQMSENALIDLVKPLFASKGWISVKTDAEQLSGIVRLLRDRVKRVTDFMPMSAYFFVDPEVFDDKVVQKHWKPETSSRLRILYNRLSATERWNEESLEAVIRNAAEEMEIGAGKLIHPIRLAITGLGSSPGLFEVMVLLERDTVLRRIQTAIFCLG